MCFLCGFVKAPSIMTLVRKLKCFYLETSLPWDTDKLDWTSGSCCRHTSQGKVKSKGPFWKNACQIRCSSSNRNTGMIFAALEKSYFFSFRPLLLLLLLLLSPLYYTLPDCLLCYNMQHTHTLFFTRSQMIFLVCMRVLSFCLVPSYF